MKKLVFLSLFTLLNINVFGQELRPFEDALRISNSSTAPNDIVAILKRYAGANSVATMITSNKFLAAADLSSKILAAPRVGAIQASGSSFSFIPQKDAIDALGTFVAERFKQEINIAFLDKFKKDLEANPNLKIILPETVKYLVENDPYNYASFLETFRATLKKDLDQLTENIPTLIRANKGSVVSLTNDQFATLMIGLEAIKSYSLKKSSASIILDATKVPEISSISNGDLKFGITLLNLMTDELTDRVSNDWNDEIKSFFEGQDADAEKRACLFLGLFYEKNRSFFGARDLDKMVPYVAKFYKSVSLIKNYQVEMSNIRKAGISLTNSEIIRYAELSINMIDQSLNASDLFGTPDANAVAKFLPIAKKSLSIISSIQEKQYAIAFVNSLSLTSELLPNSDFKTGLVKYGNFAVNIVTAENAEAMGKALETAALPVGSYKIKRNAIFNIGLNAYAGGFFGYEFLNNRGDGVLPMNVTHKSPLAGFSAPLGITFSLAGTKMYNPSIAKEKNYKRFKDKDGNEKVFTGSSWSLFITAIDLGAVTAFRLTNDKTETLPDVTFKNIIAPGAYLVRGMRGVPISYGIGGQYGPQVRKIEDFDTDKNLISAWNVRLFIAIDIPLFNFYTKMEK